MTEPNPPPQVTYAAKSIFSSRTAWFNTAAVLAAVTTLVTILADPAVIAVIPPTLVPTIGGLIAVANVVLRMYTVRPAVLIAPGTMQGVVVEKLTLPQAVPDQPVPVLPVDPVDTP